MGMLEVQVERDPKTGVTVVRSVTPVSAPAAAPKATPIFDDGRKSIHTVGGSPGQPSSEELRQILSVADGFGMKVLLDEVAASPHEAQLKTLDVESSRVHVEKVLKRKKHMEAKQKIEKEPLNVGYEENQTTTVVIDNEVKLDSQNLEENPVTLLFLGYADDPDDPSQEDPEGMITVERVMITEDGEETLLGHETPSSLQSASGQEAEQECDTETPVQNPPNAAEDERGVGIKPPKEEEEACKGKQKTCKCCSVM
uniref:Paralemmin n=1 Tax=Oryzias latipes TaxID=8090 RepID=A0A3B3I6P2_ORYLA